MAKVYEIVCDFTGKRFDPAKGGVEDHEFRVADDRYLIDLSPEGVQAFEKALDARSEALQERAKQLEDLDAEYERRRNELKAEMVEKATIPMQDWVVRARKAPLTRGEFLVANKAWYERVVKAWNEKFPAKAVDQGNHGKKPPQQVIDWYAKNHADDPRPVMGD